MPRIKEVSQLARRFYAQAMGVVALQIRKSLTAVGFTGPQKTAGGNRTEVTQAAFPDKLSDSRQTTPGS